MRFLRGFSNYLTPRLGLFSGDTWAAVGVSLRNLILNFTILSLSLAVPLFLPWLVALLFWTVVAWHVSWGILSCAIVVVVAAVLLGLPTFTGTVNMARPTRDGKWTKSGASRLKASHRLRHRRHPVARRRWACQRRSTWAQASGASRVISDWMFIAAGALAYGAAWLLGLLFGFVLGSPRRQGLDPETASPNGSEGQALGRALWAGPSWSSPGSWPASWARRCGCIGSRALIGLVQDGPRRGGCPC